MRRTLLRRVFEAGDNGSNFILVGEEKTITVNFTKSCTKN